MAGTLVVKIATAMSHDDDSYIHYCTLELLQCTLHELPLKSRWKLQLVQNVGCHILTKACYIGVSGPELAPYQLWLPFSADFNLL